LCVYITACIHGVIRRDQYRDVNRKEVILEAIESKIRRLETQEILAKIDELDRGLEPTETPAWKLIREDRDADH